MRHGNRVNQLGRKSAHRKAMLANMASSLIKHKRISTTLAKARELRKYIEPLVTKSKNDTTHSRRVVFSYLQDKYAVTELFREVSQKVANRPGGYTRILKTGFRQGDNAEMCIIEFVDYNETYTVAADDKKKAAKTRRGRKKSDEVAPKAAPKAAAQQPAEKAEESKVTEEPEVVENVVAEETPVAEAPKVAEEPATQPEEETKED